MLPQDDSENKMVYFLITLMVVSVEIEDMYFSPLSSPIPFVKKTVIFIHTIMKIFTKDAIFWDKKEMIKLNAYKKKTLIYVLKIISYLFQYHIGYYFISVFLTR